MKMKIETENVIVMIIIKIIDNHNCKRNGKGNNMTMSKTNDSKSCRTETEKAITISQMTVITATEIVVAMTISKTN